MNISKKAYINKIDNIPNRKIDRLPLKGVTRIIEKTKYKNLEPPSRVNLDSDIYVDQKRPRISFLNITMNPCHMLQT